ncbi:sensor histidine kinase [Chitinophaga barathri]|nr:histidine kinase [Chitinophaga barathri]
MKKIFALFCFLSFAGAMSARAQVFFEDHDMSHYFLLQKTIVTVHANYFVPKQTPKRDPVFIDSASQLFAYDTYSRDLTVSIVEADHKYWSSPRLSGQFFTDQKTSSQDYYKTDRMEVRITHNGRIKDWKPVETMPSFEDPWIRSNKDGGYRISWWLFKDTLAVGDSLLIELRRKDGLKLQRIGFVRKPTDFKPFVIQIGHDTTQRSEQAYINSYIKMLRLSENGEAFYKDRPGNNGPEKRERYFPGSRLTFFFRRPSFSKDEQPFEYRITGGRFKMDWESSGPVIITGALQAGDDAVLEVRYREKPQEVYRYGFYVPEAYYQAPWFKILEITGIIFVIMLVVFIFITRRRKRELSRRKLEMKALYAQLNPHFVFNALSSIQGLVNDRQTDKANEYLTGFSTLLRNSMQSGQKETVPLELELRHLDNYIRLEKLRFNFEYGLELDPLLPLNDLEVPPFLAQPMVENAVKHGVAAKGEQGELIIRVSREGRDIVFSITDNGPGFNPTAVSDRQGIRLTRDRIALFNKTNREKQVQMNIQSNQTGTTVVILYKNWTENA